MYYVDEKYYQEGALIMLKFIGTGDAFNTRDGNTSAYLKLGREIVFFDMGEDVFSKAKNMSLFENVEKVHVFITHLHSDHVGSLGTAIAYLYYGVFGMDKSKICVYFPSKKIVDLLQCQGVTEDWYTFYINRWDELFVDSTEKYPEYIFEENIHTDALNVDGKSNCYSIELSIPGKGSLYYSGDSAGVKDRLRNRWAYDYIYHEVTSFKDAVVHTSYETLMQATKGLGPKKKKRIFLMHMDENFDKEQAVKDGFSIAGEDE